MKSMKLRKFIALATTFMMIFSFTTVNFPALIAHAEPEAQVQEGPVLDESIQDEGAQNVPRQEIVEKRTEFSNTYQNSDGTYTDEIFADQIRFKDESGKLANIDNSIVKASSDKRYDGYVYANAAGPVDILLSDKIEDSDAIRVEKDKYSIRFSLNVSSDYLKFADWFEESKANVEPSQTVVEEALPSEKPQPTTAASEPQKTVEEQQMGTQPAEAQATETPLATEEIEASGIENTLENRTPTETEQQIVDEIENERVDKSNVTIDATPEIALTEEASPKEMASEEANSDKIVVEGASQEIEPSVMFDVAEDFTREEQLESKSQSILYKNALDEGIDVRITPQVDGIKEEIIFYEKPDTNIVSYTMNVQGMYPKLIKDGPIIFYDSSTNKEVGIMPHPYLMDSSSSHIDEDAEYELVNSGDGTYTVNIRFGTGLFERDDVSYPIILDPTFSYQGLYNSDKPIRTTYLSATRPTSNFFGTNFIRVSGSSFYESSATQGRHWAMVWVTDNVWLEYAQGRTITKATLDIRDRALSAGEPAIRMYPITAWNWKWENVTWNSCPSYNSGSYVNSTGITGAERWDITQYAKNYPKNLWSSQQNNGTANNGFYMAYASESNSYVHTFHNQNHTTTSYRPKLNVTYTVNAPTATITLSQTSTWGGTITVKGLPSLPAPYLSYQYSTTSATAGFKALPANKVITGVQTTGGYIWVRIYDSNGSAASTAKKSSDTYKLDTVAPTAPTITLTPTAWQGTTAATIKVTGATDAVSGIRNYQYALGGTTAPTSGYTSTANNATTWTIAASKFSQGETYVWVRTVDNAGNTSAAKRSNVPYKKDTTAPNASGFTVTLTPTAWQGPNGAAAAIAVAGGSDAHSGIKNYQWAQSSSSTTAPTTGYVAANATGWSIPAADFPEGETYVWVKISDNVGNLSTAVCSDVPYKKDVTPPTKPTAVNLMPKPWQGQNPVGVSVEAVGSTDTPSGIAKYQYSLDNNAFTDLEDAWKETEATNPTWVIPADVFGDVESYIWVRAVDYAGNIGEAERSPTKEGPGDPTQPTIAISSPQSGSGIYINGSTEATVDWEAVVGLSNIRELVYRLNGADEESITGFLPEDRSGNFTVSADELNEGDNSVDVELTNGAGMTVSDSLVIKVDQSAPNKPVVTVEEIQEMDEDPALLQAQLAWVPVADLPVGGASGVEEYQVYTKAEGDTDFALAGTADAGPYTLKNLEMGVKYTAYVRAVDKVGNHVDSEHVEIEIGMPEVTDLAIDPTGWSNQAPEISWDIESALNLADVQYQIKQGDIVISDWATTGETGKVDSKVLTDSLPDGEYIITVRGVVGAGPGTVTKSVTYKKDTAAPDAPQPTVAITYQGDGKYMAVVDWSASTDPNAPDHSGMGGYLIKIGNGAYEDIGNVTQHTFEDLSGTQAISVKAYDNAGNESGEGSVSAQHPQFTVSFESNGGSDVDSMQADAGSAISVPANPTKNDVVFGGWYKDDALTQNWNFATDKVEEDITLYAKWVARPAQPTLSIEPEDWAQNTLPEISWTGIDYDGTLTGVQYKVGDDIWGNTGSSSGNGSTNLNFAAMPDGEYIIYIRGVGEANGETQEGYVGQVTYKKDTTAPAGPQNATLTPADWQAPNGLAALIAIDEATDTHSGIKNYQFAFSSSNTAAPSEGYSNVPDGYAQWTLLNESFSEGETYVWVQAVDNAGNVGTAVCSNIPYKKDVSAPSINCHLSISRNTNNTYDIAVGGMIADNLSGIQSYTITLRDSQGTQLGVINGPLPPIDGEDAPLIFDNISATGLVRAQIAATDKVSNTTTPPYYTEYIDLVNPPVPGDNPVRVGSITHTGHGQRYDIRVDWDPYVFPGGTKEYIASIYNNANKKTIEAVTVPHSAMVTEYSYLFASVQRNTKLWMKVVAVGNDGSTYTMQYPLVFPTGRLVADIPLSIQHTLSSSDVSVGWQFEEPEVVDAIEYRIDGGEWTILVKHTSSAPIGLTGVQGIDVSGLTPGTHTLEIRGVNQAGPGTVSEQITFSLM